MGADQPSGVRLRTLNRYPVAAVLVALATPWPLFAQTEPAPSPALLRAERYVDSFSPLPEGWKYTNPIRGLIRLPESNGLLIAQGSSLVHQPRQDSTARCMNPFVEGELFGISLAHRSHQLLEYGGLSGRSGVARVVDLATGSELRRFTVRGDCFEAGALSPRGLMVALNTPTKGANLWRVDQTEPVAVLALHTELVTALEFSADGNWLLSGDREGTVLVSEADTGIDLLRVPHAGVEVRCLSITPSGRRAAIGLSDGKLRVIDLPISPRDRLVDTRLANALSVHWIDEQRFAVGGPDGQCMIVTLDGGAPKPLPSWSDHVLSLAWSPDRQTLFTGGHAGQLGVHTIKPPK